MSKLKMDDHEKTPWNPSRKATARVKDPLPIPTVCPHCGGKVECVSNAEIYNGTEYGEWSWAYLCRNKDCGAYVGLHPFTALPLGTLATFEIREARKVAKTHFNKLFAPPWQKGKAQLKYKFKDRTEAYAWLQLAMGLPASECHFAMFDVAQCMKAIEVILEKLK